MYSDGSLVSSLTILWASTKPHLPQMPKDSLTITDNRTGETYELPITHGTIRAMDLRQIKTSEDDFGMMSYDPAYKNTASTTSRITFIDGEKGILRYRGYPIGELAEHGDESMSQISAPPSRIASHSNATFPPKLWPSAPRTGSDRACSSSRISAAVAFNVCGGGCPSESPCSRRSTKIAPHSGRAFANLRAMLRQLARVPRIP